MGISGGINVPVMWGSKSTCTKDGYGGFKGRRLLKGDELELGKLSKATIRKLEHRGWRKDLIPQYQTIWEARAVPGPNSAPDYFTEEGMEMWYSQPMQADHNSGRLGYRLRHPKPIFGRKDGGVGGAHPSNVIVQPYRTPGSLNVCGDFGIILFDNLNSGGFVVPLTVIRADLWKIGQTAPGRDYIRFVYCTVEEGREALIEQDKLFTEDSLE